MFQQVVAFKKRLNFCKLRDLQVYFEARYIWQLVFEFILRETSQNN